MNKFGLVCALALAAPLGACASSALMVDQAPTAPYRSGNVTLQYLPPTIGVEENTQAYIQSEMEKKLITGEGAPFARGTDLTIRYQFVGHNEGSRVGRYLTAGLAGGSKTYIMAEFVNPQGVTIGRIRAEGAVGMGVLGGSAKSGIDGAINQIRDYATANFRR